MNRLALSCLGLLSRLCLAFAVAATAGAEVPIRVARPIPPGSFTGGLPRGERVYLFDMGTASSPVRQGFTRVLRDDLYSREKGFGFESRPAAAEHLTDDITTRSDLTPQPFPAQAASGDTAAELAKFDRAGEFLPASGPAGTEWDADYRSFIQTDESAIAKGLPSHAAAAARIKADAAADPARREKHKGWVLFIKHHSQKYRPEQATADLRRLHEELVEMGAGRPEAKPELPFEGDPRLIIHRDVAYGSDAPARQNLDAYLVKSPRPTPVLIEVHGGGWRRGAKSQFVYAGDLMEQIIRAGISVVSINYRLTPEHRFPAQMEDIARAVQFVRSRAREWNLDPDRIAAMGGSAGGHLSAWLALHDELAQTGHSDLVRRQSTRLRGAVVLWAPVDLTRVRPTELARQPSRGQDFANAFTAAFGCTEEEFEKDPAVRKQIREASPLFLVTPDDPPLLVMGPSGDEMSAGNHPPVPEVINDPHSAWHGVLLADALRGAGVGVTTRIGPFVGKDTAGDSAAILEYLRRRLLQDAGR